MEDADYFRAKAEQCRRLAASLVSTDGTVKILLTMAEEYEARATELVSRQQRDAESQATQERRPE